MLKFDFTNETRQKFSEAVFKKIVDRFYKVLKNHVDKKLLKRNGNIELVMVDDETIRQINRDYRKKDRPTDVISFAYLEVTNYEKERGDVIVGDIFISVDTAKKQSKEKNHSLEKEMAILFVHGMLHCFGFDHKNDKQEAEMELWAKKVLTA